MCLTLYLGTGVALAPHASADLRIEPVALSSEPVLRHFSSRYVCFVGAHTGCSCGFPSISSETPIEYFDGMFEDGDERRADLRSLSRLLALLAGQVTATSPAELYAVWEGDEAEPALGTLTVPLERIEMDRFFFLERFLYRIVKTVAPGQEVWPATH